MKTTIQTSRGPVRFHSVGEPIAGMPAIPPAAGEAITRKQALSLIAGRPGPWQCRTLRDPLQLGDYGRREIYSNAGRPVLRLDIQFNPPKCAAFAL